MSGVLGEMLLIEEPSVLNLYREMVRICSLFVAPLFLISLVLEYFGMMDFPGVVKRLLIVVLVMGSYQVFHETVVKLSLDTAQETLKKVSPENVFVKKWLTPKLETKQQTGWGWVERIAIPNLNDLLATAFFLLAKVCTWLLKLIYSTVYHLSYVLSGISALLYFFKWTDRALIGTFQSTLWCMVMPFVVVAVLALVGNTLGESAVHGQLVAGDIQRIIWLFGVTLMLLITPAITWGMVKGDGIASAGNHIGQLAVSGIMGAARAVPMIASSIVNLNRSQGIKMVKQSGSLLINRFGRNQQTNNSAPVSKNLMQMSSQMAAPHVPIDKTSSETKIVSKTTNNPSSKERVVDRQHTQSINRKGAFFHKTMNPTQPQRMSSVGQILKRSPIVREIQKVAQVRAETRKGGVNEVRGIRGGVHPGKPKT